MQLEHAPEDPSSASATGLKRTAAVAAGTDAVSRALAILLSVLLARVLGPAEMGILGAAQLLPGLLSVLSGLSETAALVRHGPTQSGLTQARAATQLRLLTCIAFVLLTWIAGPPFLRTMLTARADLALAARLQWLLALGLLLEASGAYPRVRLQWQLRTTPVILGGFAQTAAHVVFALSVLARGWGLTGIVVSLLTSQAIGSAVVWVAYWTSTPSTSEASAAAAPSAALRRLLGQYLRLFGSTALGYVNQRLDNFLVGAALGATSMAQYSIAWTASRSLSFVLAQTYSSAILPVLAATAHRPDTFRRSSGQAFLAALWIVSLAAAALWVFSDPLLPLVLGEKWRPALIPLRFMAVSLVAAAVVTPAQSSLVAEGRAERVGLATLVNSLVVVAAVPPVAAKWGLAGAAAVDMVAAWTVAAVLATSSRAFCATLSSIPSRRLVEPLAVAVLGAGVAVRVTFGSPVATLLARGVAFPGLVLVTSWLVDRSGVRARIRLVGTLWGGERTPAPEERHVGLDEPRRDDRAAP